MGAIDTTFNVFKAAKDWKIEYEKKHDKDLYISRMEDLLEKAENENLSLNNKIIILEKQVSDINANNESIEFNDFNLDILEIIYDQEWNSIEIEQWVKVSRKDYQFALDKLKMSNYIFINDSNRYDIFENRKFEIITAFEKRRLEIESKKRENRFFEDIANLNKNTRGY